MCIMGGQRGDSRLCGIFATQHAVTLRATLPDTTQTGAALKCYRVMMREPLRANRQCRNGRWRYGQARVGLSYATATAGILSPMLSTFYRITILCQFISWNMNGTV